MTSARTFVPSEKFRTKLHLWVWLIFLICIFPFVFLGFIPDLGWTYVWIFLVANAVWIVPTVALIPPYYRSIEYELGDEEIVVRQGIITKVVKTIPYRTMTNIEVKRGVLDRWLGIGGIAIHTAGFSQQSGPEARLSGLEDYDQVHQEIFTALRRYRARAGTSVGVEEVPAPEGEIQQLLREILQEVRALRESLDSRNEG